MQREAVHDRRHAELAHAVVEIVAAAPTRSPPREPDHRVRLEPARSAEPPISSGRTGARPSSASCDALRVATLALSRSSLRHELACARREILPAARRACGDRTRAASSRIRALVRGKAVRFHVRFGRAALARAHPRLVHVRGNLERRYVPLDGGARRRDSPSRRAQRRAHRPCRPCSARPCAMTVLQQMSVGSVARRLGLRGSRVDRVAVVAVDVRQ